MISRRRQGRTQGDWNPTTSVSVRRDQRLREPKVGMGRWPNGPEMKIKPDSF